MRKRLRKKLRKGEFKELAVEFIIVFRGDLFTPEYESCIDDLFSFAEALGVELGGSEYPQEKRVDFIGSALKKRGSISLEQREKILNWLEAHEEVIEVRGSQLFDLCYLPRPIPY